jgi:hypothetical protein
MRAMSDLGTHALDVDKFMDPKISALATVC